MRILRSKSLGVCINGLRDSVNLVPDAPTEELVLNLRERLVKLDKDIADMEATRAPLDRRAANHTRRVLTGLLLYLLGQAAVVAKLTFFSRFGWDVMEPVTYFLT